MGMLFSWMIFRPGSFLPQISYKWLAAQKIRLLSSVGTFYPICTANLQSVDSSIHTRFSMVSAMPRESNPEPSWRWWPARQCESSAILSLSKSAMVMRFSKRSPRSSNAGSRSSSCRWDSCSTVNPPPREARLCG